MMTSTLNSDKSSQNGHLPPVHNGHLPPVHNGHLPPVHNGHEQAAPNGHEQASAATGIRVILADSQAIYRVGMKKVFALEDDIRVVAQAETLENLRAALERHPTDVVVLEGQLIAGTVDAIPELVKHFPDAKLIVQVVESDEDNIVELYRRGVRGVVPRSISPDLLIKCVRKIADGETWIDNQSISWVIEAYRSQASSLTSPRVLPKLTKKELAIISCITRGMRNKEIAYQIGTTEQVIKNYLRKVYDKLGVSDRLELALYCLHHQLLKNYSQEPEVIPLPVVTQVTPLRAKM
jgi:DNA-binding NarL/FixJ family response regulator